MKKKYVIAEIMSLMIFGLWIAGCGEQEAEPLQEEAPVVLEADVTEYAEIENGNLSPKTDPEDSSEKEGNEAEVSDEQEGTGQKVVNLSECEDHFGGKVESISDKSMVIKKTILQEGADGGLYVVMSGEESTTRVTVICTDKTKYQYWVIKTDSGKIDMKEGTFDDIQVGTGLEVGGFYDGDSFIAEEIIIEIYK